MDEQKPEEVVEQPTPEVVVTEEPKAPEPTPEQLEKIEKQRKFFNYLRAGAAFIQFVEKDLENMRKQKMNRHLRRRAEKDIRKGFLTPEIINLYAEKMEEIVAYIEAEMSKQLVVKPVTEPKENA